MSKNDKTFLLYHVEVFADFVRNISSNEPHPRFPRWLILIHIGGCLTRQKLPWNFFAFQESGCHELA